MGKPWSDAAISNLVDWSRCPLCDYTPLHDGWCPNCGADLNSPVAVELATASEAAVQALQARQAVLDRVPIVRQAAYAPPVAPTVPTPAGVPVAAQRPSSQLSVQSVLAVAGAGLVAIAAIVFTFFNPDLTDDVVRTTIVAAVSLIFLGAAALLARAGLQFSAEAVGALAMVFVALDVWAIATQSQLGLPEYGTAAIATLVVSAVMIGLASLRRLRTWLWSGAFGLLLTPLLVGLAVDNTWSVAIGWLGVGAVALALHELLHPLERRFGSRLLTDHVSATVAQFVSLALVLILLIWLPGDDTTARVLGTAGLVGGLGVLGVLATRNGLSLAWSYLAGGLLTAAVAVLPLAHTFEQPEWLLAIVPAAAIGMATLLALTALLTRTVTVHRVALLAGALSIAALALVPAAFVGVGQVVTVTHDLVDAKLGLGSMLGLAAGAAGAALIAGIRRASGFASLAVCLTVPALAVFATWSQLVTVAQLVITLALGVAIAAAVTWLPALRATRLRIRVPLLVGAHGFILLAVLISWSDETLAVLGGVAIVVAIAALAFAVPRALQPVHVAAAFAYGLGVFAYTLGTQTDLWGLKILGLTATLALVVGLGTTLLRVIPARFWYAILLVAALPFAASVGATLAERSGWTGLAVGVAFVLALVVALIRRPGLGVVLRVGGASLLLPTLSVVVVDVVPQVFEALGVMQSASPIILPVIAGFVALTLPLTALIGSGLQRLGHADREARGVQLALEISVLATGAIAVLLALLRTAAGFDTTFLVLAIIGLGAAATGQFVHRRYAWYVAYISFTGALWSLLALGEIDSLEAYVLPPAIVAALIGVYAVARGAFGLVWYAVGLGLAVLTPLAVLVVQGNPDGVVEWRAYALLAASALLILVAWLVSRIGTGSRVAKLRRLHAPTLWLAIGAAFGGVIQAIRYGSGADLSALGTGEAVLVPVLLFTLGAVALAALAGWLLARAHPALGASRWVYAPAVLFAALGPIPAFRHGTAYPVTMLLLMLLLLLLLLATVWRARGGSVTLPPVWLTFAAATAVGIAGWSEHSIFRVEAYSLPLGAFLLAAGIIAWRPVDGAVPSINRWPVGYRGSWWLLAPGLVVILVNSIMSTGTDPVTWRAILVIAIALVAILIGNLRKLAAPFILGIIALPIENIVVFAVQIGDKIQATTWWITLATAGAVLLVLAVSSERGTSGGRGVAARMRDLR